MVSTDILLTGSGLVCCVASKPRIKQVLKCFKVDKIPILYLKSEIIGNVLVTKFHYYIWHRPLYT